MIDYTVSTYQRKNNESIGRVTNITYTDYFVAIKAYKTATLALMRTGEYEFYAILNENDKDKLAGDVYMEIYTRTLKFEEHWLECVVLEESKPKVFKKRSSKKASVRSLVQSHAVVKSKSLYTTLTL